MNFNLDPLQLTIFILSIFIVGGIFSLWIARLIRRPTLIEQERDKFRLTLERIKAVYEDPRAKHNKSCVNSIPRGLIAEQMYLLVLDVLVPPEDRKRLIVELPKLYKKKISIVENLKQANSQFNTRAANEGHFTLD